MNRFQSIDTSFTLKNDYDPRDTKDPLSKALLKRRSRHADSRLGIKDQFPRETKDEEKTTL